MTPKPHPSFSNLTQDGFASLLRERLIANASEDARVKVSATDIFDDAELQHRPPVEAFRLFYGALTPQRQTDFRRAIGQVLGQARPGHFPPEGVTQLVLLAGSTKAHESIRAIVDLLSEGIRWDKLTPALFVDALAVLKGMTPSTEAELHTGRLATSAQFPSALVFDALEILLACNPSQWPREGLQNPGRTLVA